MKQRSTRWLGRMVVSPLALGFILATAILPAWLQSLRSPMIFNENDGNLASAQARSIGAVPTQPGPGRPMTPIDILAIRTISGVAVSPDGEWAAVVVQRTKMPGESYQLDSLTGLTGNDRADVWLIRTDGSATNNVTHGERDHAGYWGPVWSPDGKRLAMVSTKGGDNVRAYVYDLAARRLRRLTRDGVDLGLHLELEQQKGETLAWLDPTRLLVGILPTGRRPLSFDECERTAQIAVAGAVAAKRGRSPTANVLTSGEGDIRGTQLPRAEV
ncbi:MAG: TolB family protein, partial [Candidatus Binatia bacterium]